MDIQLRPLRHEDLETVRLHRNEPLTRQWLEDQRLISAAGQEQWFANGGAERFRILQAEGNSVGLARVAPTDQCCTIGLDIFSRYRGQGLAEPCFRAVMAEGLRHHALLDLWVFLDNARAIGTYRKCGFVHDHSTAIKHFTREVDGRLGIHAYVRMVYERPIV